MTSVTLKTADDRFGNALKILAKSDQAKAEFLLQSIPPYYSNIVENIRSKESYKYRDVARKLAQYIPFRQKGYRSTTRIWQATGTQNDPIALATYTKTSREEKSDNGKTCRYCQNVKK
jgi:hypothetical protein